jgi:DNA-binding GntR family transcriptional regulator
MINTPSYRTMTEIATEAIKDAILNGIYSPGTRLVPAKLEKELNLGRVAIREAIRELSGSGLVVSEPNKGAVVAKAITEEELRELFDIRYDLEGKACILATQRISHEEIQKLENLNNDLLGYVDKPREYFLLNRKWHLDFYQSSGRNFLCQIITQLFDRVLVFRSVFPFRTEAIPGYISEHIKMLAAMKKQDGERVSQILVGHLQVSCRRLIERSHEYQAGSPANKE